jgi:hypothetical protein
MSMSLTSIVKKALFIAAAVTMCGCEHKTTQVYDFNKDGKHDTVTTWYFDNGNKSKEKIVLHFEGKSKPTTWVDTYDSTGYRKERTFDNDSDGKLEGRTIYDSTGGVTRLELFDADGKTRTYK